MSLASISSSNYVLLYGNSTANEKLLAVSKVTLAMGNSLWQALIKSNPNILTGYDTAVIFNNSTLTLTFLFSVSGGSYNLRMRCFGPSTTPATAYSALDDGTSQLWSLAPSYIVYQQVIPLYNDTPLEDGMHKVSIRYGSPIALVDLTIENTNGKETIVIPALHTFLFPNKKYIFSGTNAPDFIVPAINTKLYGIQTTSIPSLSTGTLGPDLSCSERSDISTPPPTPYLVLYGNQSQEQTMSVINQIMTYCGGHNGRHCFRITLRFCQKMTLSSYLTRLGLPLHSRLLCQLDNTIS